MGRLRPPVVAGAVSQLWRYPVKSLQGEALERTQITDVIPHDRGWGVIDTETGNLLSAKTVPALLMGSARVDGTACVVTLPDGTETGSTDPDIHDLLSAWLERPVRLQPATPGIRSTIAIELDDGQDDPGELPVVEFPTQPGWFYDSTSSLHIISTATLALIEQEVGANAGAAERFRPNIVVELDEPFGEEVWLDTTLAIGGATAWVKKPTDRCVLITRPLPGAEGGRGALRFLARRNDRNAGISAQPRSPGAVSVGDVVAVAG